MPYPLFTVQGRAAAMAVSQNSNADPSESFSDRTPMPAARYFYSGAALTLLLLAFWGFDNFYLHGKAPGGAEITPQIRTLVIVHGIVMTAWMILFAVQPQLIARRNYRVHMALGKVGAAIALAAVVLGSFVAVDSARFNPPDALTWGLLPRQFLTFTLVPIWLFGAFVAFAIWNRGTPDIHRPMMLTAVLAAMPPPLFRIDPIREAFENSLSGNIFGPFAPALALALIFLIVKWILFRGLDRWQAIGCIALAIAGMVLMRLATTGVWDKFASMLV